jgi:glycosyltransferase involved in cell wall biosynthesis
MGNEENKRQVTISAIIIARNEEAMIADCIASLQFCDEIIVVDSGSSDNTADLAFREGAKIVQASGGTFKDWRGAGLEAATGDWVLYIDADERVTPKLAREIAETIEFTSYSSFLLRRNNIHFGKWLQHGGWEKDMIVRLFKRSELERWEGDVHEHAIVKGITAQLKEPLVHLTHRNIKDGLVKSYTWTDTEARLLYEAHVKPVTVSTLLRKTIAEFVRRLVIKQGWKDGIEGWIESMQQAMNRFLVYERLWELQQRPSLEEKYSKVEKEIARMWEHQRSHPKL